VVDLFEVRWQGIVHNLIMMNQSNQLAQVSFVSFVDCSDLIS
jgi:hypothetical protein